MKKLSIPLILLCATSFCSAATVPDMVKKLDEHIQATYLSRSCEFKYYLTDSPQPELRSMGTLSRIDGDKRLDVSINVLDKDTRERFWTDTRYLWKGGQMYENVVENRVTSILASDKAAAKQLSLEIGWPWSIESLVGGNGGQTLASILADPLNVPSVVKETDSEVVVDIVRGTQRWLTVYMDPKNHYVITRFIFQVGEAVFRERKLAYKDGLLESYQNIQSRQNYLVRIEWTGETDPQVLTVESLTEPGDILLKKDQIGTQSAFRNVDGEMKPESIAIVKNPSQLMDEANALSESTAVSPPAKVQEDSNTKWIYAIASVACCVGLIACLLLLRRKAK